MNAQRLNRAYAAAIAFMSLLALAGAAGCGGNGQATATTYGPGDGDAASHSNGCAPDRSALPDGVKLRAGHTNGGQQPS